MLRLCFKESLFAHLQKNLIPASDKAKIAKRLREAIAEGAEVKRDEIRVNLPRDPQLARAMQSRIKRLLESDEDMPKRISAQYARINRELNLFLEILPKLEEAGIGANRILQGGLPAGKPRDWDIDNAIANAKAEAEAKAESNAG